MRVIVAGAGGGNADGARTLGAEPAALDLLDPRAVRPGGARRRARLGRRADALLTIEDRPRPPATPPRTRASDAGTR